MEIVRGACSALVGSFPKALSQGRGGGVFFRVPMSRAPGTLENMKA